MNLTDLLDEIDRLDQEATDGPWTTGENDETGLKYFGTGYCDCCTPPIPSAGVILGETGRAEAEFIALARTALPQLAKALEAVMVVHQKSEHQRAYGFPRADKWEHYCTEDNRSWPCPTVKAITDALGDSQ